MFLFLTTLHSSIQSSKFSFFRTSTDFVYNSCFCLLREIFVYARQLCSSELLQFRVRLMLLLCSYEQLSPYWSSILKSPKQDIRMSLASKSMCRMEGAPSRRRQASRHARSCMDNFSAHVSPESLQTLSEIGMVPRLVIPNFTHLLQPNDMFLNQRFR